LNKLIKFKVFVEVEVVGENVYCEDNQKTAIDIWRRNRDEILKQLESTDYTVKFSGEVNKKEDLPTGWTEDCFPWLPTIPFGNSKQDQRIKNFLKE
jgi:hypothetical protein